jgi:hypothetical protein
MTSKQTAELDEMEQRRGAIGRLLLPLGNAAVTSNSAAREDEGHSREDEPRDASFLDQAAVR